MSRLSNARNRRKSLYDPTYKLFRTHTFAIGATNIATGDVFPDREKPITIDITVKRTGASPQGVIAEFGSSTTGLALWFSGTDQKIHAAAGDGLILIADVDWVDGDITWTDGDVTWFDSTGSDVDGITLEGTEPPETQIVRIVFSVIPTISKARLWINGKLVAHGEFAGAFPNGWSDTEVGAVGDISGSATSRIPVADRITLADAAVLSPLSAFHNQRPRQFFEVV